MFACQENVTATNYKCGFLEVDYVLFDVQTSGSKPNGNQLKSMEDMTASEGSEREKNISLKIIMDKLNTIEARSEDNFTQVHSQMGELRYELKQEIRMACKNL